LKNTEELIARTRKALANITGSYVGIAVHRNADPDAIASAVTLSAFLEDLKIRSYIFLPEGMNRAAKNLVQKLGLKPEFYDLSLLKTMHNYLSLYIVLDTTNFVQLGDMAPYIASSDYILIDHHEPGELAAKASYALVLKTSSTSELIYLILREGWYIPSKYATMLLTGIMYDSRRYLHVDPLIFRIVDELVNLWGANYYLALNALAIDMDISERIARLKGSKRSTLLRRDELLVAVTKVGAFEASVANALIELGVDAAFVISEEKCGVVRIVARATRRFIEKTGLKLGGGLLKIVAEMLKGSGGGHETAGVVICKGNAEDIYRLLVETLRMVLNLEIVE